jgi:BirA family biotin operon repressor/biotin-[acetyl-CoA-carboxylase] ligase
MVVLDEVESTSDFAAERVREAGLLLPLCVWSRRQTRGRGRGSHSWWSDSGGLTFTVAIDPEAHGLARESEPKLALATAVAVIETLIQLGFHSPALGIRWPNDIVVQGQKLGGILPESVETAHGRRILVGIGINLATDRAEMPAEIRPYSTSLSAFWKLPLDEGMLREVLARTLDQFGNALTRMVQDDPELARRWDDLDLLRGEWVSVDMGAGVVAGWGCGIEEDGALCLDDGRERHRVIGGQVLR